MYSHTASLEKRLTPITPATAEEVWAHIPQREAEFGQLTDIPEPETGFDDTRVLEKWEHFMSIRDDVLKALENARNKKVIGKPLEAKLTIVPKDEVTKNVLAEIPHLHQLLIVSQADVVEEVEGAEEFRHVAVKVERHPEETCERCWMSSNTVGVDKKHPSLCSRCADIVNKHYSA